MVHYTLYISSGPLCISRAKKACSDVATVLFECTISGCTAQTSFKLRYSVFTQHSFVVITRWPKIITFWSGKLWFLVELVWNSPNGMGINLNFILLHCGTSTYYSKLWSDDQNDHKEGAHIKTSSKEFPFGDSYISKQQQLKCDWSRKSTLLLHF